MSVPPLDYEFATSPRIAFGWGRRRDADLLGKLAGGLGRRGWLVSGSRTLAAAGEFDQLIQLFASKGVEIVPLTQILREPETTDVDQATDLLLRAGIHDADFLLAIGGGSAIDLAKAVALMVPNRVLDVSSYLRSPTPECLTPLPPLPILALPTTGGTGSEATRNAVISSPGDFKKSIRHEHLIPRAVLVDPELAVGLSPQTTAHTGMDAITQLIESYLTKRPKPIPQALAIAGLELALPALPQAVKDGSCRPAREAMAQAALLSGMALANSGLGMAHGVAAALGVHCQIPHGLACAVMLTAAMEANRKVREAELARLAPAFSSRQWSTQQAASAAVIEQTRQLCQTLGIPQRLTALGVRRAQLPAIVGASYGNSMSHNPREISPTELLELLEQML